MVTSHLGGRRLGLQQHFLHLLVVRRGGGRRLGRLERLQPCVAAVGLQQLQVDAQQVQLPQGEGPGQLKGEKNPLEKDMVGIQDVGCMNQVKSVKIR